MSLGQSRQHFDYMSQDRRGRLLDQLASHCLEIDTIHGPQADTATVEELAETARAAAHLKAPVVVVHGGPFEVAQSELEARMVVLRRKCRELEAISHHTGIVFALENVAPGPATELVRMAVLEAEPGAIGFCYDSSHDQIDGPRPFSLLMELRQRLVAMHLSDRVRAFVDHVLPGEGFIRWDTLCGVLAARSLTFPLLLEVMTANSTQKDPATFLDIAFEKGQALSSSISDAHRKRWEAGQAPSGQVEDDGRN